MTCEKTNNAYNPELFGRLNHNFLLNGGEWQEQQWSGSGTSRGIWSNFGRAPVSIVFIKIADRYVKCLESSQREKWWGQLGNVRENQWPYDRFGRPREVSRRYQFESSNELLCSPTKKSKLGSSSSTELSSWKNLATHFLCSRLDWENFFADTAFQSKAQCIFPRI
jgi:hypothetical protein